MIQTHKKKKKLNSETFSCQHWKPLHILSSSHYFKVVVKLVRIPVSSSFISHWAVQLEEIQTCPRRMIHLRAKFWGDAYWGSVTVGSLFIMNMAVGPKIGVLCPKMDGENNGKPYEQMDDLGGPPLFLETPVWIFWTCILNLNIHHGDGYCQINFFSSCCRIIVYPKTHGRYWNRSHQHLWRANLPSLYFGWCKNVGPKHIISC